MSLGQINLVPNGNFETAVNCPTPASFMAGCANWANFGNTPDYFNACFPNPFGTPNTQFGYQAPHSGVGLSGLLLWYNNYPNYREYIGDQLITPLTIGQKYYFSFYISYSGYYQYSEHVAANKIGLRLSTVTSNSTVASNWTTNWAHFKLMTIYKDTLNWLRLSGSIIADSAYKYVVIGNFFNDANTDTSLIPGPSSSPKPSYYFVDDVYVGTDSMFSQTWWTNIKSSKTHSQDFFRIYPNPVQSKIKILPQNFYEEYSMTLTNYLGLKLSYDHIVGDFEFDVSEFQEGLYFIFLKTSTDTRTEKILISR